MKKTLGVVAAAALAAMPAMAVFAADVTSQTDTIKVTVDPVCTFKEISTGINYTHAAGTDNVGTWNANVLSGKMTNGSSKDNYGSTTLTVVCNNKSGWEVTGTSANLAGATSGESIDWNANHSATVSGISWTVSQAADHGLTIPSGKQGAASSASVAKLAQATDLTGKTFTVTYGVGVDQDQAADTYTGTFDYTLGTAN